MIDKTLKELQKREFGPNLEGPYRRNCKYFKKIRLKILKHANCASFESFRPSASFWIAKTLHIPKMSNFNPPNSRSQNTYFLKNLLINDIHCVYNYKFKDTLIVCVDINCGPNRGRQKIINSNNRIFTKCHDLCVVQIYSNSSDFIKLSCVTLSKSVVKIF